MPYYEFIIYASRKRKLEEIQETLVNEWEFDKTSVHIIRRPLDDMFQWAASHILSMIGLPDRNTWVMFITGPEIYREQVYTCSAAWEARCDGGGYDFSYDPYPYYSQEQVRAHTEEWEKRTREAEARLLEALPQTEREKILSAHSELLGSVRDHEERALLGHLMAQEDDED